MLTLNLTQKELSKSEKLSSKIESFTTFVNDRLCDKFKDEILFESTFQDDHTMIFTIDTCNEEVQKEVAKTIDKLLQNKKYTALDNRKIDREEEMIRL